MLNLTDKDWDTAFQWYLIPFIILTLLLSLFVLTKPARAEEVDISIIIQIESGGNPNAYNKHSGAIGLMQITPICLKEYNQRYSSKEIWVRPEEIYDYCYNTKIGSWYINKRIPELLCHYRLPDTIDNRLIAYNFGIGNLIKYKQGKRKLPQETINYLRKYHKLERRKK